MSATSGTIFSFDFLAILDFLEPNIAAGKGSEALRFMVYQPQFCNVFEFFFELRSTQVRPNKTSFATTAVVVLSGLLTE